MDSERTLTFLLSEKPKALCGGVAGVAGAACLGKAQADFVHGGVYARHARQGPR